MRIAFITESCSADPYSGLQPWCRRLLRGMPSREFDLRVLARDAWEPGEWRLPGNVADVRIAPVHGPRPGASPPKGRRRRAYLEQYAQLVQALAVAGTDTGGSGAPAELFASGLYGLAALARDDSAAGRGGALAAFLTCDDALRTLEAACRAPGAHTAVAGRCEDGLRSLLAAADAIGRLLGPLSAPWYGDPGSPGSLAAADLCHVSSLGAPALSGLLARHWFGTPLLVTEYGSAPPGTAVPGGRPDGRVRPGHGSRVRALEGAFHRLLAHETCRRAALVTAGNLHIRRWQERYGADRERIRVVYPGLPDAEEEPLAAVEGEPAEPTVVWVGEIGPAKDLIGLLHAFAEVRRTMPQARLRIVEKAHGERAGAGEYARQCRALAAQLFPDEAPDPQSAGESPVAFESVGTPEVPGLCDAYAAGSVVVLSSVTEGFPGTLIEAMLCGRATVSTDTGAVREVIGGTGLVVPVRNPKALAAACLELLADRERRRRLGAAARARAQELFTARQSLAAFHRAYLELVAHSPVAGAGAADTARPFSVPAEARLPGRWAFGGGRTGRSARWVPGRSTAGHRMQGGAAARLPGWAARSGERGAHGGALQGRTGVR